MGVNGPEPAFFWDDTTKSWRKPLAGEPGEYTWNPTTNSWEFGSVGAEYKWNHSTRSWDFGPGGEYVYNHTTRSWDKVTSPGYGGPYYFDTTTQSWVPNSSLYGEMLERLASTAALYDPSDLTSLYQSRTGGSTGAADAVVGIMLDKRQMGNKSAASFIAGQSELVTNGGFDADASWTKGTGWTISGGKLTASSAATNADTTQDLTSVITLGNWYSVTYTISDYSAGTFFVLWGGATGAARSGNGTFTEILRPTSSGILRLRPNPGPMSLSIDNISVKAIPGSHALAPSDAACPILRVASGLSYLDCDGTDDWMQVFPTLNLGEQWAHVGGWKVDANDKFVFGTTSDYREHGIIAAASTLYQTRRSDDTGYSSLTASSTLSNAHVLTVERGDTPSIAGRVNGAASASTTNLYVASGETHGLALFNSRNSAYVIGLDGRFYGGIWQPGSMSTELRSLCERWAAGKCGVSL